MDVRDKVVAITGAARGLGQEFAKSLAAAGARIVAGDINDCDATLDALAPDEERCRQQRGGGGESIDANDAQVGGKDDDACPMQAYDDARKRLSENVKKARKKIGLSQEALALHAGINRSYVGQIERGIGIHRSAAQGNRCFARGDSARNSDAGGQ